MDQITFNFNEIPGKVTEITALLTSSPEVHLFISCGLCVKLLVQIRKRPHLAQFAAMMIACDFNVLATVDSLIFILSRTSSPERTDNGPYLASSVISNPLNSLIPAFVAHLIKLALGSQDRYDGTLTRYKPPNMMNITKTAGAMAVPASTDETKAPTLMPNAVAAIDSFYERTCC